MTETGRARTEGSARDAYEAEYRRRWRSLGLLIKAELAAVADGIVEFETEFLPHIVLPTGETVAALARPAIALAYDDKERRIWCEDCQTEVPAFDAFTALVERWDAGMKKTRRLIDEANEAQRFTLRSRAAKEINEAWRKHNRVPACPHCRNGLFPEDFAKGVALVGKDYAKAMLAKKRKEPEG